MEKIFSQKDLALGFVHKLNNHLASMIGYGELLMLRIDPEAERDLRRIIEEAKQASQVSKDLADVLRKNGLTPKPE